MALELEIPQDMDGSFDGATAVANDPTEGMVNSILEHGEVIDAEFTITEGNDPPAEGTEEPEAAAESEAEAEQPAASTATDATEATDAPNPHKPTAEEVARFEWKCRIRAISDQLAEAALERLKAETEYKAAKAHEKMVLGNLASEMNRGPQVMPLFDSVGNDDGSSDNEDASNGNNNEDSDAMESCPVTKAAAPGQPAGQVGGREDWESVSISELKLKPRLQERLEEAGVNTIGRLEQLRADISTFREKWPKGIGAAKITEIEDAVVMWLRNNRDRKVFDEIQASQPAGEPEAEKETDPDARASQLEASEPDLAPKHAEGSKYFESGRDAYGQGWRIDECPWVPGVEKDDWLRGYASARALERKHKTKAKASKEPKAESARNPLDDL